MDSENPQQANSNGVDISPTSKQPKGPEDLVIVQIKSKSRDALKTLKKYRRETNAEILERVITVAVASQEAPAHDSRN
jgi:hypothetical protein